MSSINRQQSNREHLDEWQKVLMRLWPEVRRRHLYPELPLPRFDESNSPAAMEIRSKQIILNLDYARRMTSLLAPETVVAGLLDHGISHYTCCPWDLSNHLRLYARAKDILDDSDLARKATDLFMDVVADTHAVKERESCLPELYRLGPRTPVEEAICSLYEKLWGMDLAGKGSQDVVRRLVTIPYLDRRRWLSSLTRFIRGIRPLLEEAQQSQPQEHTRMGAHGFQQYRPEEIDRALREFAREADSPEQFADVLEDLQNTLQSSEDNGGDGMGHGVGAPKDANRLYYMKLAENYALPLRKIPLRDSGHLHPHSHRPWEVCQPFRDLDPWSSFGKYLPGITQIWERREGLIYGKKEKTPDCLVIIDSSGSMVDPRTHLSHAVLGGGCASDAYLRHDASVAVYNFSDAPAGGREFLPFTRSRQLIYKVLCRYFGGGTALNLDEVTGVARESEADIFLITDMQITNLDQTVARFSRMKNRVTAVHVGKKSGALRFIKASVKNPNISVFGVNDANDIPQIVLGSVRSYLSQ
ncbi:MAG: hypothetical protein JSU72_16640 [Deltaproteobacteria bacterium]|nr:MAG: hypothetical protein JSU72_16640 [Deltaproteobacteria bacterium]